MPENKVPWTQNILILTGIVFAILIPLALVFISYMHAHPRTDKTRAEDVALALLIEKDVADATQMGDKLLPYTVQFNDQFQDGPSSTYKFAIARSFVYTPTGADYLLNTIAMYSTREAAQKFIMDQAKGQQIVEVKAPKAESSVAYFSPKSTEEVANLTLRFTEATLAVKIQIYDVDNTIKTKEEAQKKLGSIAEQLANDEHSHLWAMIDGSRWFADEPRSQAMQHLHHTNYPDPETISGASYLGSASTSQNEWDADSGDFDHKLSIGFVSGALARYKIDARPDEAVEVSVLEFDTSEHAQTFAKGLLTTGVALDPSMHVKEVKLPSTLNKIATAAVAQTEYPTLELQSAQGKYVVDVLITSPFGTLNVKEAEKDLVMMSASILNNFKP